VNQAPERQNEEQINHGILRRARPLHGVTAKYAASSRRAGSGCCERRKNPRKTEAHRTRKRVQRDKVPEAFVGCAGCRAAANHSATCRPGGAVARAERRRRHVPSLLQTPGRRVRCVYGEQRLLRGETPNNVSVDAAREHVHVVRGGEHCGRVQPLGANERGAQGRAAKVPVLHGGGLRAGYSEDDENSVTINEQVQRVFVCNQKCTRATRKPSPARRRCSGRQ